MAMKFNGNGTIEGLSLGGLGDSGAVDSGSIDDTLEDHLKSGRKNLIINGDFDVWQRGYSFVSDEYTADRWKFERSGGAGSVARGTFDAGQTDVPGSKYYLSMDCSTGNNNFGIHYAHEYVESIQNRKVTVSFYAKHNQGNTNPVNLPSSGIKVRLGLVAVGGTTDTIQTLTPTDTWVKYSFTFDAPTTDGATIDANSYHQLSIFQDSADTGEGIWDVNLAQVQMEIGEVATDFEHRSYGEELALCQRYWYQTYDEGVSAGTAGIGHGVIGTQCGWLSNDYKYETIVFPTTMRDIPIIIIYDYHGAAGKVSDIVASNWPTMIGGPENISSRSVLIGVQSSIPNHGFACHFTADAEL